MSFEHDIEKREPFADGSEKRGPFAGGIDDGTGAVPAEMFEVGDSTYARLQRFAGKFNIEQRGIERVPDNERTDTTPRKVGTMWLAANLVVSSFAIGLLGPAVFYLGVS